MCVLPCCNNDDACRCGSAEPVPQRSLWLAHDRERTHIAQSSTQSQHSGLDQQRGNEEPRLRGREREQDRPRSTRSEIRVPQDIGRFPTNQVTNRPFVSPEQGSEGYSKTVGALQRVLIELQQLQLQTKQAHWNVSGTLFQPLRGRQVPVADARPRAANFNRSQHRLGSERQQGRRSAQPDAPGSAGSRLISTDCQGLGRRCRGASVSSLCGPGAEPVQGFLARVSDIGRASVYRVLGAGGADRHATMMSLSLRKSDIVRRLLAEFDIRCDQVGCDHGASARLGRTLRLVCRVPPVQVPATAL